MLNLTQLNIFHDETHYSFSPYLVFSVSLFDLIQNCMQYIFFEKRTNCQPFHLFNSYVCIFGQIENSWQLNIFGETLGSNLHRYDNELSLKISISRVKVGGLSSSTHSAERCFDQKFVGWNRPQNLHCDRLRE